MIASFLFFVLACAERLDPATLTVTKVPVEPTAEVFVIPDSQGSDNWFADMRIRLARLVNEHEPTTQLCFIPVVPDGAFIRPTPWCPKPIRQMACSRPSAQAPSGSMTLEKAAYQEADRRMDAENQGCQRDLRTLEDERWQDLRSEVYTFLLQIPIQPYRDLQDAFALAAKTHKRERTLQVLVFSTMREGRMAGVRANPLSLDLGSSTVKVYLMDSIGGGIQAMTAAQAQWAPIFTAWGNPTVEWLTLRSLPGLTRVKRSGPSARRPEEPRPPLPDFSSWPIYPDGSSLATQDGEVISRETYILQDAAGRSE